MSSVINLLSLCLLIVTWTSFDTFTVKAQGKYVKYAYLRGGTPCKFEKRIYKSGEVISRRNPCHHCVCVRGQVQCFWQNCPPPPEGCTEMAFKNICNPSIYNCPIPDRYLTNANESRANVSRTVKYGFRKIGSPPVIGDCVIRGIAYFTGEVIGVAANNCLECRCAKHSMYCTPLCCHEHASSDEELVEKKYRLQETRRPIDPNPLAHISEDLGLKPVGTV